MRFNLLQNALLSENFRKCQITEIFVRSHRAHGAPAAWDTPRSHLTQCGVRSRSHSAPTATLRDQARYALMTSAIRSRNVRCVRAASINRRCDHPVIPYTLWPPSHQSALAYHLCMCGPYTPTLHMTLVGYLIVFSFVTKCGQTIEFPLWGTTVPFNFLVGYHCSIVASTPHSIPVQTHTYSWMAKPSEDLYCSFLCPCT